MLAAVALDCECGDFSHVPNVTCQPPPPLDVKHDVNLFVNAPQRFFSSHFYTLELIVQFRGSFGVTI